MDTPTTKELRRELENLKERGILGEDAAFAEDMVSTLEQSEAERGPFSWGGARPGAGRPPKQGEKSTCSVLFNIKPSEKTALLERFGEEGESIHKVCKRLVKQLLEGEGEEK